MKQQGKLSEVRNEIWMLLIGCLLYVASTLLIDPVNVVPGSVIGIAITAHSLTGVKIGVVTLVLNVPIMFLCTWKMGKKVLIYTVLILVSTSLLIDWWLPYYTPILADNGLALAVLGGLSMGIAAGLLMRAGGTMGGTTAITMLIRSRFPKVNITLLQTGMDSLIVVGGCFLLKSFSGLLLSELYALICSKCIAVIVGYEKKN